MGSATFPSASDALASDLRRGGKVRSSCWLAMSLLSGEVWLRDAVARRGDRRTSADPRVRAAEALERERRLDEQHSHANADREEEEEEHPEPEGSLLSGADRGHCEFLLRSLEVRRCRNAVDDEVSRERRRRQREEQQQQQQDERSSGGVLGASQRRLAAVSGSSFVAVAGVDVIAIPFIG